MNIIEGTARNMGVAVEGLNDKELQEQAEEAKAEEIAQAKAEAKMAAMEEANNETTEVEVITEKKDEE